jgi:hypothetical protein
MSDSCSGKSLNGISANSADSKNYHRRALQPIHALAPEQHLGSCITILHKNPPEDSEKRSFCAFSPLCLLAFLIIYYYIPKSYKSQYTEEEKAAFFKNTP